MSGSNASDSKRVFSSMLYGGKVIHIVQCPKEKEKNI
jgi:hypothetical protein